MSAGVHYADVAIPGNPGLNIVAETAQYEEIHPKPYENIGHAVTDNTDAPYQELVETQYESLSKESHANGADVNSIDSHIYQQMQVPR